MKQKAIAALLLCGMLLTAAACGDSSGTTVAEEDLPYGATLTLVKNTDLPSVQYDTRFLTEEMVQTVLAYYDSIEEQNTAAFTALQLPLYREYELNTVYENAFTDEDLIANAYAGFADYFGGDFKFSMIDITDCIVGDSYSTSAALLEMLDGLSEEKDGTKISEDITEFYELTVTRYLAAADSDIHTETDCVVEGETLFLLQYLGQWYIIYN